MNTLSLPMSLASRMGLSKKADDQEKMTVRMKNDNMNNMCLRNDPSCSIEAQLLATNHELFPRPVQPLKNSNIDT